MLCQNRQLRKAMKTPEQGGSWGILGGTFDPIHNGHTCLASDILRIKNLDGILFIPSFLHPFKNGQIVSSFDERIKMLQLAISSHKEFSITTIERDNKLPGYTLETILSIKKMFARTKFYFLIGADNISQLPLWHNIDKILKETQIIAGKRPPFKKPEIENDISKSIEYIQSSELLISSTEIKQYILNQEYEKLRTILHPDVLQYIIERKLYSQ